MLKWEMYTEEEAWKSVGANEQLLLELVDKLRQWLKQQAHLPQDLPDRRLKVAILSSKLDFEKTKRRIDAYYTFRTLIPEFYSNRDPRGDDLNEFFKCAQCVPLPNLSPEKYRITIFRLLHDDSSMFDIRTYAKHFFMMLDLRMDEDTVNSNMVIWDMKNYRMGHLLKYTPTFMKKLDLCLETYGMRVKAIYLINAPNFIERLLTLIRQIVRPKLVERLQVHTSGIESMYGLIQKSSLPADYGGEQPSMDTLTEMWRAKLSERADWFREQEKIKSNESLRSDSTINSNDLFGVSGTFRKLEID